MKAVCVYCGSAPGSKPLYAEAARAMGRELASRGLTLVYGGGNVGTMGALAQAAMESGAKTIGIIPRRLNEAVAHLELSELIVVEDMHERKAAMQEKADAFIAMPGGIGTFEEFFEIWTWRFLGYHAKPVGLLNTGGFYDSLLSFLAQVRDEGFLKPEILADLVVESSPGALLDALAAARPAPELKSFERTAM
ncbi:MAG: TIGR00730 family Rossman fold protein [Rectinemataceae bacterium]